ncbi:MAG: ImmA/IrrE family metallo-endopeptidase [Cytophagales bacterium]
MGKIEAAVQKIYKECGMFDPLDLPIEDVIRSKNILLKDEKMDGCHGRILPHKDSAIITINSKIEFDTRRKFVMAHEFGHFILHRHNKKMFQDNAETLNQWYHEAFGLEEIEANEFAAEFLMPAEIFSDECNGEIFTPEFIDYLADGFEVSKTAAILRFVKHGNYPVCVIYCKDNKMKWFKSSDDWKYYIEFERDQHPPTGSVAYELFTSNTIYTGNDRQQPIKKSTWIRLNKFNDWDSDFYEYCLFVPSYNYSISVIWED